MIFKVTAWDVRTDKFSGYVYSQKIVLDKMEEAERYEVQRVFLYRKHRPIEGVIYEEVESL